MAGNVSEWTESPYSNSTYQFSSTLNPYLSNQAYREPRKSVRGGSWKDVGYVLMTGYRDWERKDSAKVTLVLEPFKMYLQVLLD